MPHQSLAAIWKKPSTTVKRPLLSPRMSAVSSVPARLRGASTRTWRSSINAASAPASPKNEHYRDVVDRRCILGRRHCGFGGNALQCGSRAQGSGREFSWRICNSRSPVGGAVARVSSSPIEMMVTTDSILATEAVRVAQTSGQITIAPLLAEAILRISNSQSVSSLFD